MNKAVDISTKKLISLAPNNWAKWVTGIPDIVTGEILNTEFQWISRQSDVVIPAESPQYGKFLILNELQLRHTSEMPRRMRAYAALAEEKYKLQTYPVLINILKISNSEIPTSFASNFIGLRAIQDYRVINLWEIDVNIAFETPLPSLLPFVPILKGGENESTIREALRMLRADEQLNQLETVLAFFATFVLESTLVQEIMRWDMTVLRESPWYQEILREGQARGEAEGEARGEVRGIISSIETSLEAKFGSDGLELMSQISQISDLGQLKEILRRIVVANTIQELRNVL
ncbi:MAG: Rpn family recombination-promoting nuclease/putative transposase [Nostoc sp. EfeVER01]|uniref:Rpn family recombination-promoting nuclease/putative transposase n=1 Tax=unclassified Nostoc TaxID=2593658 RepID=UPI002AD5409E|nr:MULTISPECIES: Rpn family recombination-promoting nuclease/putative transposase [unclassified Nostoc]MDZ7944396.1 Rpn family recombination-promoting nuclease/putative transposase [Nostoc sp. EfeVER01]MDZ7991842.1 Rpn family recombination-promoting nuclease/putative transposase [Nostoc sp. EspVER01]